MSKDGDRIYAQRMRFFEKQIADMRASGKAHMVTEPEHPDSPYAPESYVPDITRPTYTITGDTMSFVDLETGELQTMPVPRWPSSPVLQIVKPSREPK